MEEAKTALEDYRKFKSARGTSALESFHHHARVLIKTKNASPELYHALMSLVVWRWNVDRAVAVKKYPDYGYYNYQKLQIIHLFRKQNERFFQNKEFPLQNFPVLTDAPSNQLEKFGAEFAASQVHSCIKNSNDVQEDEWEQLDEEDQEEEEDCDDRDLAEYAFDIISETMSGVVTKDFDPTQIVRLSSNELL
jgi:hypothetical protein